MQLPDKARRARERLLLSALARPPMEQYSLDSAVDRLGQALSCKWPAIADARTAAAGTHQRLRELLAGSDSDDASIVVFGSLARQEFTIGSDLDWTLLIDGQADPQHSNVVRNVISRLEKAGYKEPGREGIFGNLAFSHDIIHLIGGEGDTNRNITQRTLLLLESTPVNRREAYDRVIRNILQRYLTEDRGLWRGSKPHRIPRFLLNDIVRYWRTIAVDYAYKQRERAGRGLALRNAKLRMSRS